MDNLEVTLIHSRETQDEVTIMSHCLPGKNNVSSAPTRFILAWLSGYAVGDPVTVNVWWLDDSDFDADARLRKEKAAV